MATISIRVDDKLKEELTQVADDIGLSVSSLFTVWAKSFLRTGELTLRIGGEDEEMYLNADALKKQFEQSAQSGRGSLVL